METLTIYCAQCNSVNDNYQFSCSHNICNLCLHNSILATKVTYRSISLNPFIQLKCFICLNGEFEFEKTQLIELLKQEPNIEEQTNCFNHINKPNNLICVDCKLKVCFSCAEEHLKKFPKHQFHTISKEDISLCLVHRKAYKFQCTDCNVKICSACKLIDHNTHTIRYLRDYLNENIVKAKEKFSFKSNDEIDSYVKDKFESIKNKLLENQERFNYKFANTVVSIENILMCHNRSIRNFIKKIEEVEEILKLSYKKYLKNLDKNMFLEKISFVNNYKINDCSTLQNLENDMNTLDNILSRYSAYLSNDNYIQVYENIKCVETLQGHEDKVWCLIELKDGRLASGSSDNNIKIWNQNYRNTHTLSGHSNKIWSIIELNNGNLVSASSDSNLIVWCKNFSLLKILSGHTDWVVILYKLKDGKFISGSRDSTARVWDDNYNCISTLSVHSDTIWSILELNDGRILTGSRDSFINVWVNYSYTKTLNGHSNNVFCLLELKNGNVASASWDSKIIIWDKELNLLKILNGHTDKVWSIIQIKNKSKNLISVSSDKTIRVWDENYDCIKVIDLISETSNNIIELKDGRIACALSDFKIRIFDENFNCVDNLNGHTDSIVSILETKDGQLITGSSDKTIRIWK